MSGPKEAVLFDAQFSVKDGEALVEKIRRSGKTLNKIVITSGDPDFYFGLQPLVKAFPNAKLSPRNRWWTISRPQRREARLLGATDERRRADAALRAASVSTTFMIDGERVNIEEPEAMRRMSGSHPQKTILGGTGVSWGIHVWTADTQTPENRKQWQQTLDSMAALKPEHVIPGHYLGTPPAGTGAIDFTRRYLQQFEQALTADKASTGVINTMKKQWPNLAEPFAGTECQSEYRRNEVVIC